MFYWTLEVEVPERSLNLPNIVIMKSKKIKQISLLMALPVPYEMCNGHCESDLSVLECHIIFSRILGTSPTKYKYPWPQRRVNLCIKCYLSVPLG